MKRGEALYLRSVIEQATQSLDDNTALTAVCLHPEWMPDTAYTNDAGRPVGFKVQRNGKLWRLRQEHTSAITWEPENVPSLWEQINETHTGELNDPIPYEGNMALENKKYYTQDNVIYLCTRDTVNPVYNNLADLVGLYVEIVE